MKWPQSHLLLYFYWSEKQTQPIFLGVSCWGEGKWNREQVGGLKGYLVVLYTVCFFVFMVSGARHNEKITAMASFKVFAYLDPMCICRKMGEYIYGSSMHNITAHWVVCHNSCVSIIANIKHTLEMWTGGPFCQLVWREQTRLCKVEFHQK